MGRPVQSFPDTGLLSGDPDLSGHLWVQELPTGGFVRFRVADSGLITLGTRRTTFEEGGGVPLAYLRASQHLRERLDVDALREATDDTDSITFFGIATRYEGIDYEWPSPPPLLGVDAWSAERGGYLPPDATVAAFEQLGLSALPAVEKEVPAEHASLEDYTESSGMPASAWYDGPAAGVLVRDKSGGRARAWHPTASRPAPLELPPPALAERVVTDERLDRSVDAVGGGVEAALDRVLATVAREAYAHLFRDDDLVPDERAFRAAVAERVRRHVEG